MTPHAQKVLDILEGRAPWPEGFEWNYQQHRCCVMGLSWTVRGYMNEKIDPCEDGSYLGLSVSEWNFAFYQAHYPIPSLGLLGVSMKDVSPKRAAAVLRQGLGLPQLGATE